MGAKPKKNGSISYAKWGYIFIAPFFLIFALFQLIPLGSTIYYSFFEYYRSGLKIIGPTFVGLKNYITLFAEAAKKIDMSNAGPYDQGLNESFQNAFKDYFTGTVDEDTAKANFETAIKEKYPELTDVVWPA